MTKKEFANTTARRFNLNQKETEKTLDALIDTAKEAMKSGYKIDIRGFGSLGLKHRKAKIAQNIKAGTHVAVPACKIPHFKVSKEFKKLVN